MGTMGIVLPCLLVALIAAVQCSTTKGHGEDIRQSPEDILEALQGVVGVRPVFSIEPFKDWAQTQLKSYVFAVRPKNVEEIQKVIVAANTVQLKVRAVGTRHSTSPLFPDEGQIALYTTDFNKAGSSRIQLHRREGLGLQVTVQAGVTSGELRDFFLETGVQLPANVIPTVISMTGLISTGGHGHGNDSQPVSGYVEKVNLVDGNAKLRTFSNNVDGDAPSFMRAIKTSLGLFGIIYEVTIRVETMKISETRTMFLPASASFLDPANFNEILKKNWGVQISWEPFNSLNTSCSQCLLAGDTAPIELWNSENDILSFRLTNLPDDTADVLGPEFYRQDDFDHLVATLGSSGLLADLFGRIPSFALLWGNYSLVGQMNLAPNDTLFCQQLPNAIHYYPHSELNPFFNRYTEWMFTMDYNRPTRIIDAFTVAMETVKEYALRGKYPVISLGMRFYGTADGYLTPVGEAGNPDRTETSRTVGVGLDSASTVRDADFKQFSVDVTQKWIEKGYRPVPHWGKEFDFIPGINDYLRSTYAQNFEHFLEALNASAVDPHNVFFNKFLLDLFEK